MANGTTRLALAKMQLKGKEGKAQHEMIEELLIEKIEQKAGNRPGRQNKIPLKNPSEHNHS